MKVFYEYDLSMHNSYRVKSKCKRAFFPESIEDFLRIYKGFKTKIPKIILGDGNNIILAQEYYDQDFVLINKSFSSISYKDGIIEAESGCSMKELSVFALGQSLSGMEIFYDIPSSLGGAVVMNAGASGEEIKDVLLKVSYLDLEDLTVKIMNKDQIGFYYRNSFFQRNQDKIVLKVWVELNPGNHDEIRSKMERIKEARWKKQPREFPNAGSVFKRPTGFYVGALIEELNLKGYTVGGAKISEKHGGFIINFNEAKGSDILQIIGEAKKRVFDRYHIDLEVEQRIIQ